MSVDQSNQTIAPFTLKERIMSILAEDIDAKSVRWFPIDDGEDHDSWVTPGKDTITYKEAYEYVADQIVEAVITRLIR